MPAGAFSWPRSSFSAIFGAFWLKEWSLVDRRTRFYLWIGIVLLIISVVMIGVGNNLAGSN